MTAYQFLAIGHWKLEASQTTSNMTTDQCFNTGNECRTSPTCITGIEDSFTTKFC